jgi:ubiquinone/menaquinone biosynthesis C-methylase UbiE
MSMEHHHTYILDPENVAEIARLEMQSRLMTEGMGGVLPELDNRLPDNYLRVLDLACGPGEWVSHLACEQPQAEVTGLDISKNMLAYAQNVTQEQHLNNAHFVRGNLLEKLEFRTGSFDLLNARLLIDVLERDQWPLFLTECSRLLRSGGRLRLTECDDPIWQTNKLACEKINYWAEQMSLKCGYGFPSANVRGLKMKASLHELLTKGGWSEITIHDHLLDGSFGTLLASSQRTNALITWKQYEPIVLRLGITDQQEFTQTYNAIKRETLEKDFKGVWHISTISAKKA